MTAQEFFDANWQQAVKNGQSAWNEFAQEWHRILDAEKPWYIRFWKWMLRP